MDNSKTLASVLSPVARLAAIGASLALAGCGQDWSGGDPFFPIGGTVSGLSGTVVLQNNGIDDLSVAADGRFTFPLSIANGSDYDVRVRGQPTGQLCTVTNGAGTASGRVTSIAVSCQSNPTIGGTVSGLTGTVILQNNGGNSLATATNGPFTFTTSIPPGAAYSVAVQTQPAGQTCTVTNGAGIANGNVTNVTVLCATAGAFVIRPLPDVYTTGKAVNFSVFRAGGPNVGEIPSDADVLEDLSLVDAAGYNLLRTFGADAVTEKILRLAAANYPDLKFQLGMFIAGIAVGASCGSNPITADQINTAIRFANQYPSVVTVSVGNETSFFRANLPISCLEGYIQTVRSQVTQPVTADDDFTFYILAESDPILRAIDFVSIHTYPISRSGQWDWRQTSTPAGPNRAAAMMNESFGFASSTFDLVASRLYRSAAGNTERVEASLPIVVGETGWKAVQTRPTSEIETYAANPVNAKWYFDLMNSWEVGAVGQPPRGAPGGPPTVFFFEAFDETWKGINVEPFDDGWGLWDKFRLPRYALCGTTALGAPACNADLYAGAGFYPF